MNTMSWIQYHILLELTRHATRRYSQLKPRDVEGNLFMYHLKGLVKEGLVEKADTAYQLSVKGVRFAGTLSLETGKARLQPKILTAVVCKNSRDEYLFVKWHRQPNIDQISFPHGMVHFGTSVYDMARLELAEKAGLVGDISHRGEVYVRGMRGETADRHMLVHVFEATNMRPGREDELRPEVCEPFWARLETLTADSFVPGFYEIVQLVIGQNGCPFFEEITVKLE